MKKATAKSNSKIAAGWRYFVKKRYLYLMSLPGLIYLAIFRYGPMYGIAMAFQDFSFKKGIWGSEWNNFANFRRLFTSSKFYEVLQNSLILSVMRLVISFPIPIILALMMNEMGKPFFKRTAQTLMYLPHFISWVVIVGITVNFFSTTEGMINMLIETLTGHKVNFLGSAEWFRPLIVGTYVWKEAGWSTIIYLAALSAINPEYYEAATVDGASRWQKIRHISFPSISNTVVILLILAVGGVMSNGFEQTYLFQNNLNLSVSEVFETYTYRIGITGGGYSGGDYSFSAAVGLFQSVVGAILVFSSNRIARAMGQASFY